MLFAAGSSQTSDTAPFSYTLSALGTLTANATWTSSDYRAGTWGNGSYANGSAVHDEHREESADYTRLSDFERHATGIWVNLRTGISTSGVNGTYLYTADGSAMYDNSWDSTNCYTSHQEGSYANNSFNVSSFVYDGESSNDSSYDYSGSDTATNTTGFEIDGSFSGSGGQTGSWSLHKEGSGTGSAGTRDEVYSFGFFPPFLRCSAIFCMAWRISSLVMKPSPSASMRWNIFSAISPLALPWPFAFPAAAPLPLPRAAAPFASAALNSSKEILPSPLASAFCNSLSIMPPR